MSRITWDGDVAGPLLDSAGSIVGFSLGNGILWMSSDATINSADVLVVQNFDYLHSTAAKRMLISGEAEVYLNGNESSRSEVQALGAATWRGILLSGEAYLEASHCKFGEAEAGYGLITTSLATGELYRAVLYDCEFHANSSNKGPLVYWRGTLRSHLYACMCQFISEQQGAANAIRVVGDSGIAAANHPLLEMRNCTVFWTSDDSGQITTLYAEYGDYDITDCIIVQENAHVTGDCKVAEVVTAGTITENGGSFIHTYNDTQVLGDYTLNTGDFPDQVVDPSFFDDTIPDLDLRPDGTAGTPDLQGMSTGGMFPGALEPHNITGVDAADVESVWGERKQRVYEKNLAHSTSVGLRGRGIRLRLRSTDERSKKLVAGLFVKHEPERVK